MRYVLFRENNEYWCLRDMWTHTDVGLYHDEIEGRTECRRLNEREGLTNG